MSAMARTNERFGAGHVIDVVLGNDTRRVRELGHDKVKTFGAGRHGDKAHWRFIVDELLAQELIRQDGDRYPVLKLTPKGAALLTGQEPISGLKRKDTITKKPKKQIGDLGSTDRILFDRLRAVRKKLAEEHEVPPYVIFSDKTLHEMCRHSPKTGAELLMISGVGEVKLERYGRDFLEAIRAYLGSARDRR
jgi:ATP-dependent DNA helicase RecQ